MLPADIRDRYLLLDRLDSGGVATLYRARDGLLERSVAVKIVSDQAATRIPRLRFKLEVAALARLSHPAIVRLLDAGTDGSLVYLVTELVEAEPLDEVLGSRGPLEPDEVRAIGREVAGALDYAHAADYAHLDLQPRSILLGDRIWVADLGVAQLLHPTLPSTPGGTAAYRAPEQATGTGPATDVYALGVVLLECLTGERTERLAPSRRSRLRRGVRLPDGLPEPWPELLSAMTARDPGRRPSAGAVAQALAGSSQKIRLGRAGRGGRVRHVLPGRPHARSRRRALNALAAVAVLAVLAGWMTGRSTDLADGPPARAEQAGNVADRPGTAPGPPGEGPARAAGADDERVGRHGGGRGAPAPSDARNAADGPAGARSPGPSPAAGPQPDSRVPVEPAERPGGTSQPADSARQPAAPPSQPRDAARQPAAPPSQPRDAARQPAAPPSQPHDAARQPTAPPSDNAARQPAAPPRRSDEPRRPADPAPEDPSPSTDETAGSGSGDGDAPPPPEPPERADEGSGRSQPGRGQEARDGRGPPHEPAAEAPGRRRGHDDD